MERILRGACDLLTGELRAAVGSDGIFLIDVDGFLVRRRPARFEARDLNESADAMFLRGVDQVARAFHVDPDELVFVACFDETGAMHDRIDALRSFFDRREILDAPICELDACERFEVSRLRGFSNERADVVLAAR